MLYRIYTENKRYKQICRIVSAYFNGFSVIRQTGYWQGKAEKSLCIEIITDDGLFIDSIAKEIKELNNQEAVYVYEINGRLCVK